MLNNMNFVIYYGKNSYIHKLNPLSKMISMLLFFLATFFSHDIPHILLLGTFLLFVLYLSKIPFYYYGKSILRFKWVFMIFFIGSLMLQIPVVEFLNFLLKIIYILSYLLLFTSTTPPAETTYAFHKILVPLEKMHISPSKLSYTFTLVLHFIPIVIHKGNQIIKNISSKGIDFYHSSFKGKYIVVKSIFIPMFTLSKKEILRMEKSMGLRNFDIGKVRTNYRMNAWCTLDTIFLLVHGIIVLYIIVSEVWLCVI